MAAAFATHELSSCTIYTPKRMTDADSDEKIFEHFREVSGNEDVGIGEPGKLLFKINCDLYQNRSVRGARATTQKRCGALRVFICRCARRASNTRRPSNVCAFYDALPPVNQVLYWDRRQHCIHRTSRACGKAGVCADLYIALLNHNLSPSLCIVMVHPQFTLFTCYTGRWRGKHECVYDPRF